MVEQYNASYLFPQEQSKNRSHKVVIYLVPNWVGRISHNQQKNVIHTFCWHFPYHRLPVLSNSAGCWTFPSNASLSAIILSRRRYYSTAKIAASIDVTQYSWSSSIDTFNSFKSSFVRLSHLLAYHPDQSIEGPSFIPLSTYVELMYDHWSI